MVWMIFIKRFDVMIADMLTNKRLNPVVTELFIKGTKLNISLVFITQYYLLCQNNWTKFYTLFYYENSKQATTSTNCI